MYQEIQNKLNASNDFNVFEKYIDQLLNSHFFEQKEHECLKINSVEDVTIIAHQIDKAFNRDSFNFKTPYKEQNKSYAKNIYDDFNDIVDNTTEHSVFYIEPRSNIIIEKTFSNVNFFYIYEKQEPTTVCYMVYNFPKEQKLFIGNNNGDILKVDFSITKQDRELLLPKPV